MGLHHNQRPTGNTRLLLSQFSGAAAAYSLRLLSGFTGGKVVRVRRSSDNSERDFTSREIDNGTLEQWVNAQEVAPADYGDGAAAAYSLRYVSDSYSGPVVRVRRDSDNTEQDFAPSEIESGSLELFCGSGDGLVTTWYDQSGNSNDATQTTASDQPRIVSAGVLVTENGRPALDFDGVDDNLSNDFQGLILNQPVTSYNVATFDNTNISYVYDSTSSDNSLRQIFHLTGGKFWPWAGSDLLRDSGSNLAQNVHFVVFDPNNGVYYRNGSLIKSGDPGPQNMQGITIGRRYNNQNHLDGKIQEITIYPTDQSANRTLIESNINSYYSIYTGPDGHVTTWYDQSGNGNDATQTTASDQPKIVDAGLLVTENGRPALDFDGVDDGLQAIFNTDYDQPNTIFLAAKLDSLNDVFIAVDGYASQNTGSNGRHTIGVQPSNEWFLFSGIFPNPTIDINENANFQRLVVGVFDSSNSKIYVDSTNVTTGDTGNYYMDGITIGCRNDFNNHYWDGNISEAIVYPSDQSSNRELIESNINNHYGIY